jgi:CxxC motif-containing protein
MATETKTLTCIKCPRGCQIQATLEDGQVLCISGNSCKRGDAYARSELTNPVRTVTTTVPVVGSPSEKMISVKTSQDVPKDIVLDIMAAVKPLVAHSPVNIGDVICENIAGAGADLIATKKA